MKKLFLMLLCGAMLVGFTACDNDEPIQLTLDVNNSVMGYASGAGNYKKGKKVTITATANYGYTFAKWSDENTENPRKIVVTDDITLTAHFDIDKSTKHASVDLGLSSGTLWAICNIGAPHPEDYGYYFAWGETIPKEIYEWGTYKFCNIGDTTMTKYLTPDNTFNNTYLEAEDDAAIANWGGNWRMPNQADFNELRKECTWTWTTLNGVKGTRVTGKNGRSIFLPAAGYFAGTTVYYTGEQGYYWLAYLHAFSEYACGIHFESQPDILFGMTRFVGKPIRPVRSSQ